MPFIAIVHFIVPVTMLSIFLIITNIIAHDTVIMTIARVQRF